MAGEESRLREPEEGAQMEEDGVYTIEKPIRYYGAENVIGIFADLAMVSHSTGNFTLYFYQIQIPETESIKALKEMEVLPARCVSRVVLSPPLVDQLYEAMGKNIAKYRKLLEEKRREKVGTE